MRLGILTFHSQLNYGGVLQCWALQVALISLGHDVEVIDRWLNDGNTHLLRGFDAYGIRKWLKLLFRAVLGIGDLEMYVRTRRTQRFLRTYLHLTPYHFVSWDDVEEDKELAAAILKFDAFVVGSDQVWNPHFASPHFYLMDKAPPVARLAYAASFGVHSLPDGMKSLYEKSLDRFHAISCREMEGVEICKDLGYCSTHVLDPTLLLNAEVWRKMVGVRRKQRKLVCYLLSQDIEAVYEELEAFAKKENCLVEIFSDGIPRSIVSQIPKSRATFKRWREVIRRRYASRVKFRTSAGPLEFLRAFAESEWCVTDSFHALMFSQIFKCNVRVLRPVDVERKDMFARVEEFQDHASGNFVVSSVGEALGEFVNSTTIRFSDDWISKRQQESRLWLINALTTLVNKRRFI